MRKNTAGQVIGAQMLSASDGSAFTGQVTVYVCGDGGTQALGSVGSGLCTHEGNGFHTYAPAQAETNFDHAAFTFTGSGAVPVTVQVYPGVPSVVLPAMQGNIYSATITQGRELRIIRGDSPNIPFDLGEDYTGWEAWFGVKELFTDATYVIGPIQATWTDAAAGHGYVPLTAALNDTDGSFHAEIEVRNGAARLTPLQFRLRILEDVITA